MKKIKEKAKDKAMIRRLIHQVNSQLENLDPGREYDLRHILGNEYWDDEEESHKALGRAFSFLVGDRPTPFTNKGLTKARHNKYLFEPNF